MNSEKNQKIVKLLWTGGWDSSFRFLQLLILYKKKVQPYYILDPERGSLQNELKAMQSIKSQLVKDHQELANFILPTQYIERHFIPPDPTISDAFERLQDHAHFGEQYKWMAYFAKAAGITSLEVGAERATCAFSTFIDKRLVKYQEDGITFFKLAKKNVEPEVQAFFKYFHFPLREISKLDMREIAIQNGFYHLMELTWFCHHPRRNGKPCGFCTPCSQAYRDGMKFRLPLSSKLKYHIRWMINREQFKLMFPAWYTFLSKLKRSILTLRK